MENGTRDRRSTLVVFMCTLAAYTARVCSSMEWEIFCSKMTFRTFFYSIFAQTSTSSSFPDIYFIRRLGDGWNGFDIFSGCAVLNAALYCVMRGLCAVHGMSEHVRLHGKTKRIFAQSILYAIW